MIDFLTDELEKQFDDQRIVDWRLKLVLLSLDMAFVAKFNQRITVTSLARTNNPRSAHYCKDKLVCAADIRSSDMGGGMLIWWDNLNHVFNPYMDIIIEDKRAGKEGPGGPHIHIEINPNYWYSLKGLI